MTISPRHPPESIDVLKMGFDRVVIHADHR
ncbi:hypothetical protein FB558_7479 [Pseudonocardia kunmingensis]|uniref:Uncharacterized protein n=1 Tax=Pseudonocardia kunmingensis TaxID=630975 RepID=A0A543D0H0_9PSEU|nr:hypothetical protein FB558_7479 [Pseudonocardia kunmingensis]